MNGAPKYIGLVLLCLGTMVFSDLRLQEQRRPERYHEINQAKDGQSNNALLSLVVDNVSKHQNEEATASQFKRERIAGFAFFARIDDANITLDGVLDEPVWEELAPIAQTTIGKARANLSIKAFIKADKLFLAYHTRARSTGQAALTSWVHAFIKPRSDSFFTSMISVSPTGETSEAHQMRTQHKAEFSAKVTEEAKATSTKSNASTVKHHYAELVLDLASLLGPGESVDRDRPFEGIAFGASGEKPTSFKAQWGQALLFPRERLNRRSQMAHVWFGPVTQMLRITEAHREMANKKLVGVTIKYTGADPGDLWRWHGDINVNGTPTSLLRTQVTKREGLIQLADESLQKVDTGSRVSIRAFNTRTAEQVLDLPPLALKTGGLSSGFITKAWMICGPFPNPDAQMGYKTDFLTTLGGEAQARPRLGDTVSLADPDKWDAHNAWTKLKTPPKDAKGKATGSAAFESWNDVTPTWKPHERNGGNANQVDFNRLYDINENVTAYAFGTLSLATAQEALMLLGSDDGVKVWINGKLVHANPARRGVREDQDQVPVQFVAGDNHILIKVEEGHGGWGFAVRFVGTGGKILRFNEVKK